MFKPEKIIPPKLKPKTTEPSVARTPKNREPDLADLDVHSGREIAGLELKPACFSRLEEGQDYVITELNQAVRSARPVQDFFVFINPSLGKEVKMVQPPNWRAVTDQSVPTQVIVIRTIEEIPKETRVDFFEVNVKGVGYLKPTVRDQNLDEYESWIKEDHADQEMLGAKVLGMMSRNTYADMDYVDQSMAFVQAGLRSEVYWAIADLKRVPFQGELKTIKELQTSDVIIDHPDFHPVEAVRLLRTNTRVEEAYEAEDRRTQIFNDAFITFNKETEAQGLDFPVLSLGNEGHERIFYREFFRRMGENVAVLLNIGYSHYGLHSSNVTMAAEFVDVGTMSHWMVDSKKGNAEFAEIHGGIRLAHIKDMRDTAYSLRKLLKAGRLQGISGGKREDLTLAFLEGFDQMVDSKKIAEQKMSVTDASNWMRKILNKVIIRRENLPSLLHYNISDWEFQV